MWKAQVVNIKIFLTCNIQEIIVYRKGEARHASHCGGIGMKVVKPE